MRICFAFLLWASLPTLPLLAQTAQALIIEKVGNAYFSAPNSVAVDSSGNVYVAVEGASAVNEIVAGTGGAAPGTVNINSTVNTLGNGFSYPPGVAVDFHGNVYVADGNSTVKEIVAGTGGAAPGTVNANSTVNTLGSGFNYPKGLAVDLSGNVYVADAGNNAVKEIVAGTGGALPGTVNTNSTINTLNGAGVFGSPQGVAVDSSGNVFVTDSGNRAVKEIVAGTGTAAPGTVNASSTVNKLGSGFLFPIGIAVDSGGNVYVADEYLNAVEEIVAGTGGAAPGSVNVSSTVNSLGSGFLTPTGVAVDSSDNVYVADSGNNAVKEILAPFPTAANGTASSSVFPSTAIGSMSGSVTVTFTFGLGGTLAPTPFVVSTQGVQSLDFQPATSQASDVCITGHTYSAGDSCTVNVVFKPTRPGQRIGAVQLFDSKGAPFTTYRFSGTGTGPMVIFRSNSTVNTLGSGFSFPYVAVDSTGNVYVADSTKEAVYEIVAGTGVVNTLGSGIYGPKGVAVDSSGNVYVSDDNDGSVKEILAGTGTAGPGTVNASSLVIPLNKFGTFSTPEGVAVDSRGNVYVADYGNNAVKEIVAGTGDAPAGTVNYNSTVNTVGSGFNYATGVALDSSGNVYVADYDNNALKEIVAGTGGAAPGTVNASSTVNTLGTFSYNQIVTVDALGNVYASDSNVLKEIVAGTGGAAPGTVNSNSTVITLGSPGAYPAYSSVAVDSSGNVYVGNYNDHQVYELPLATPPSLNFATATAVGTTDTADGPKTVTLANSGNADLTFPIPSTGGAQNPSISPNFALAGSSSCPQVGSGASSAGTLASGVSCTLLVNFTPTASGSINGSLVLTDTNLNASPSTTQTILLSGTGGIAGVPGVPTNVSATASNGQAVVTFTAPASNGGAAISGYKVVSSPGGLTVSCAASPCTMTGLTNGTTYTFTVTATNSAGTSAPSAASNPVTPIASQTITFNNPGGQVFGTSPTLTATASSGLAVVFSSSTPQICTITSGGQLTFITVGTCTIAANQPGNSAYGAAPQVLQSFTISKATASITLTNLSATYDGTTHAVTATTTPSTLSESITYNGSSSAPTAAGTYIVTATITDSNYTGTTTGTLNINKATASVTPNAASKTYGANDPALTGTLTGFIAADNVTATYTRTSGETVASSPYTISAILSPAGVLASYNITYNTASFTISKATASITLTNLSATYDGTSHAATATTTPSALSESITYNGSPSAPTAAGTYTVTATITDSNYVGSTTGTLIINKATASVAPNAASKTYGANDPALTGTLTGFIAADNVTATYTRASGETVASSPYTISAKLSPAGVLASYNITYNTASFTISKATASVTWNAPGAISYGTALSATQLNATSNIPGSFAYSPALGTILMAGSQTLSVTFTPTDTTNYSSATTTEPLMVNKSTPAVSLTTSSDFQFQSDPVNFNVTIAAIAGGGLPTGSITFYDVSTVLGTASLTNGTASYATSSLGVGSHPITAAYSGDSNYAAVISSSVSETIGTVSITSTGSGASVEASPGGQAVFTLSFAPPSGQTFPQAIQLSLSGLPSGANATFSPNPIAAGSGTTAVTLTISVPSTASVKPLGNPFGKQPLPIALGLLLLPFAYKFRKAGRTLQRGNHALLILVAALAITTALAVGLSGCGGSSSGGNSGGNTTPRTYLLTVTATAGAYSQTTTLTLVVK